MRRRRLLTLSAAATALLVGGVGLMSRRDSTTLSSSVHTSLKPGAQSVLKALAFAVLGDALPADPVARERAVAGHLERVATSIAQLAPATRAELLQLLDLLASWPGRRLFAGLAVDWSEATPTQLSAMLESWRYSSLSLRQQAYHGLRDLSAAAYFAEPAIWGSVGYPGPMTITSASPRTRSKA